MKDNFFIVAGEFLSTGMSIDEIEAKVNEKLEEYTGGLGRFKIKELSSATVKMDFWRDFILCSDSSVMYDMDMALITGIDISCFQLRPIGDPMMYPLTLDANAARFYTHTRAFLRFYKNLLVLTSRQWVRNLKIRTYKDRITFKIEY